MIRCVFVNAMCGRLRVRVIVRVLGHCFYYNLFPRARARDPIKIEWNECRTLDVGCGAHFGHKICRDRLSNENKTIRECPFDLLQIWDVLFSSDFFNNNRNEWQRIA